MQPLIKAAVLAVPMIAMVACCPVSEVGRTGQGDASDGVWIREELYFGADIPGGGTVSDSLWEAFEQAEIVPRFPNGFTTTSAIGRYKYTTGEIAKEATRIVIIYYDDIARDEALKVDELIAVYKSRFRQEAVLRTRTRVSASLQ